MAIRSFKPKKKIMKKLVASIVFSLLGRAIKACYRLDTRVKEEFNDLPEGLVIKMLIKPIGPFIMIKREGNEIIIIKDSNVKADLNIEFKNIEGALLALTAKKSVATCYAEQRFIILGDLSYGTAFVRIMNIVETYLFPRIWNAFIFNNQAPNRERNKMRILIGTIFGI